MMFNKKAPQLRGGTPEDLNLSSGDYKLPALPLSYRCTGLAH